MANMGNIQQPVQNQPMNSPQTMQNNVGVNYGLKNYQNGTRSPYSTPEIQRARQVAPMPAQPIQQAPSPAIRQMARQFRVMLEQANRYKYDAKYNSKNCGCA